MAWLSSFLVGAGLSERRARQVVIGLVILLAILVSWAVLAWRDSRIIAAHDAAQSIGAARADRAADAQAATQRRSDDARLEAEADVLEKVTENDPTADPRAVRRAYYDCVRLQQQARTSGSLTPAC